MSIEVDAINKDRNYQLMLNSLSSNNKNSEQVAKLVDNTVDKILKEENKNIDMQKLEAELNKMLESFNLTDKRIRLSYNNDINRVIIIIMDKNNEKILQQFPSEEIQNLALSLKKAIGILFDEIV